jgi:invasion protein IalB
LGAALAAALTIALGAPAWSQAPPPVQPAPKAQPKAQPKAPPQQKPPEAAPPSQQQGGATEPPLIWSPWAKLCGKEENAQQVCITARDGRNEAGYPLIVAALIEDDNKHQKFLRVTLPLGMLLQQPVRAEIDDGQPMNQPYILCMANGCIADFEASAELVGKMKKGQGLIVSGIHFQVGPMQVKVPLAEFAKSNEGPPVDPKAFEEQQKKLQEELQKKAEEYRKRIESQQGRAAPTR